MHDQELSNDSRIRLIAEAQAAARLNHINIVTVFDAGETAGKPYIVMELIQGKNLHELGLLPIEDILLMARPICAALEHAHANGIIHRDLKPENVFLTHTQTIKLVDFGLARSTNSPRTTQAGVLVGSFAYLAPELLRGEPASPQSDLYALGVLLYELITGRLPFNGENLVTIISQHLYVTPVPPSTHNATIPHALEDLVMQLLSKKAADRPGNAGDVRIRLEQINTAPELQAATVSQVTLLDRIVRGNLVARERELGEALSAWNTTIRGESNVLLISGEPGIGKTRLARELCTRVKIQGGMGLQGECYAEGGLPYAPVSQILTQALDERGNEAAQELPEHVLADLTSLSPDLEIYFKPLSPNPSLDPAAEQLRLFESVTRFTSFLAAKKPVLWLIDDVHWADGGTLSLLRHIARRLKRQRVMIVMTYREVELSEGRLLNDILAEFNRERLSERIKLTRFTKDQTRELLQYMFAEKISPEFLDGIYHETEGNPFFIEEVCKTLVEEGLLFRRDGRWIRPGMDEIRVPQSVRIAIETRLQRLPTPAQELLHLVAVFGREFDFESLRLASGMDEDSLIEILEACEHAQLIEETRQRSREIRFSFVHALIPAALREGVSALRMQRLHRRVAAALEVTHPQEFEILAYHHAQGGEEESARRFYRLAADRAYQSGAFPDAEKYYRMALELAESLTDQANLSEALSITQSSTASYRASIHSARQAIISYQASGDLDAVGRVYASLAWTLWHSGDVPAGLTTCREAMQLLEGQADSPGKTALLHELARQLYFNEQVDEAHSVVQKALAAAKNLDLKRLQVHCLTTLALTQPVTEAIATLHQAIDLAHTIQIQSRDITYGTGLSRALNNLAELLIATGQFDQASQAAEEMVRFNRGSGAGESWGLAIQARIESELGNFSVAKRLLIEARQCIILEGGQIQSILDQINAQIEFRCGEIGTAIEKGQQFLTQALQKEDQQTALTCAVNLLESYITMDEWQQAKQLLAQVMPLVERGRLAQWETCYFFTGNTIVQAQHGDIPNARQSLALASSMIGAPPYPLQAAEISQATAILYQAEQRWEECFLAFEELVKLNTLMKRFWHQAESLRQWAAALQRRRLGEDRQKINYLLTQAVELFEQVGAREHAQRTRSMLDN